MADQDAAISTILPTFAPSYGMSWASLLSETDPTTISTAQTSSKPYTHTTTTQSAKMSRSESTATLVARLLHSRHFRM